MRIGFIKSLTAAALAAVAMFAATSVSADSCWSHNGSMMRLQAQGNNRWLSYEAPRQVLWNAGVRPGTLLFNGQKNGERYSGTARVFSKFCPGNPLEYYVDGPVLQGPLRIVIRGSRQVFQRCVPTGNSTYDELVFVYSHQC